jgi:hypothetical protein
LGLLGRGSAALGVSASGRGEAGGEGLHRHGGLNGGELCAGCEGGQLCST